MRKAPTIPVTVTTKTPSAGTLLKSYRISLTKGKHTRRASAPIVPELHHARRKVNTLEFVNVTGDILFVRHQRHLHAVVKEHRLNNVFARKMRRVQLVPVGDETVLLRPDLAVAGDVANQQMFAHYVPFEGGDGVLVGYDSGKAIIN